MKLSEFFEIYLVNHLQIQTKEWPSYKRHFELYLLDLAGIEMADIKRLHVVQLKTKLSQRCISAANKALTLLSMIFNKAIDWEVFDGKNPVARIEKFRIKPRERYLKPEEIEPFLISIERLKNATMRDYFKMLLLTGQRRRNVAEMEWNQIDFAQCLWVIPETKNGTQHTLPLPAEAISILSRRQQDASHDRWVFPRQDATGPIRWCDCTWKRVITRAGIKDLRIHDLRRTHATYAASSGESLAVVGRILNHKHAASTQIYARVQLGPVRQAMENAIKAISRAMPGGHF